MSIKLYNKESKLLFLWGIIFLISCQTIKKQSYHPLQNHAIRLLPGADLRNSIQQYVNDHQINAGWMVTCVGSLTDYRIRFANQSEANAGTGHFEIVSLTGTVSTSGSHMHISVSDSTGKTIGGHLLEGCKVYTTAEIVIQSDSNFKFTREKDGTTPWEELQIKNKKP